MTCTRAAIVAAVLAGGTVSMPAQPSVSATAPFSESSRLGRFIVLAGTRARDASGAIAAKGDVRAQTQACLDNIRALIEEAGGTMKDIVKCTVYVTDRAYWQPMNEVYFANFTEDPPHRVSCIVSGLGAPECLVEIDATAYLGE